MDKKSIETRINQISEILLGARKKVIDTFIEKGYASDPFIEKTFKNAPGNRARLLPHIYSFEIIMAPIGYITALSRDLKRKPAAVTNFLMDDFINDEKNKDVCKKIFDIIWNLEMETIIRDCEYKIDAFPYGKYLNYEAMSWVYGAAIDGIDFLKATNDERIPLLLYAIDQFMNLFFKPTEIFPIDNNDQEKLKGFYFSKYKFGDLERNFRILKGSISKEHYDMFVNNIHTKLAYANSNRSVLAVFDITKDVVEDLPNIAENYKRKLPPDFDIPKSYNAAFEKLHPFAKELTEKMPTSFPEKNSIEVNEMYYHICNLGILTSGSSYEGTRGIFKKSEKYWNRIIDYFLMTFLKQKEYKRPVSLFAPTEIPPDVNEENPDYILNVPMPILIRSIANMLNNAKKLGIDPKAYEDKLVQGIDLFIKEYKDKKEDYFVLPGDDGKLEYDLSLTNMAVECLTLSLAYFLDRWQEFEEEKPTEGGAWISNEDLQKFEHWKDFKKTLINEFDSRINHALTNHIDELIEKKLPSFNITSQNVNTRFRALDEFFSVLEKTNNFLEPKDKQLKELWVFILDCTRLMDEIKPTDTNVGSHTDKLKEQIEKVRKIRENVISHYFFLNQDQNFENILNENQAELKKIKE
ncbi:MAG: hypothetical protein MUF15_14625, partial [Acidobacteria bacterium]|nr:hypothetical protein [Acidobacteriota bacterium]